MVAVNEAEARAESLRRAREQVTEAGHEIEQLILTDVPTGVLFALGHLHEAVERLVGLAEGGGDGHGR